MWALEYIGKEWKNGGQGPDAFDCWGLVRAIQRDQFGIEVPHIDVDAYNIRACIAQFVGHDERKNWQQVEMPAHGDCVLMSQGTQPSHVGIWLDIDGGGVIHSVQGAGVVFSKRDALSMTKYNIIGFYRWNQCAHP